MGGKETNEMSSSQLPYRARYVESNREQNQASGCAFQKNIHMGENLKRAVATIYLG